MCAVLVEIDGQWAVTAERPYLSEASMKLIAEPRLHDEEVTKPAALSA